jgi:hypothetical protein
MQLLQELISAAANIMPDEIYLYLLKNNYSNFPSCIEKWEDLFPFLHNIFRLPLDITQNITSKNQL